MRKYMLILLLIVLVLADFVFAEKIVGIEKILKPNIMVVDDTQLYLTEGASIYIYSLKDFKLKKKFGKAGQGPQEFLVLPESPLIIHVETDDIIVNSAGKLSFFSKDGVFKKEMKTTAPGSGFIYPFKGGFVGRGVAFEKNILYITVNLYDTQLKNIKEIYRMKSPVQSGGKVKMLNRNFVYYPYDNKIFVSGKDGCIIKALDHSGKNLFSIKQEIEKRKFNKDDEKDWREVLRIRFGRQYELYKNSIEFPDYFPEIAGFTIVDNKIFVVTWNRREDKSEFFVFDLQGKLLKKLYLPLLLQDAVFGYPWAIKNGKLYQLIEDPDTEEWELHVLQIKI